MKIVFRVLAAILFVLFFGFAVKNAHEVTLRAFMGQEWHTPLALLLLVFFMAGAIIGVLAMVPTVFRQRRELSRKRVALEAVQKENETRHTIKDQPPRPDSVITQ